MEITNEKSNKKFIVSLIKLFWIPSLIIIMFVSLFIVFQVIQSDTKKHFIKPNEFVSQQEPNLYIVSTYYDGNEVSISFLQTLKELEKEYQINYYLIDIIKYPILEEWEIKYLPTYLVFERKNENKSATLLYKSYGNKNAAALAKEIKNVQTYGKPINSLGEIKTFSNFNIQILSVMPSENSDKEFKITAIVTNNSADNINSFCNKDIICETNSWDSTNKTLTMLTNEETFEINPNSSKTIEISFSGGIYNQINLHYKENSENVWTYKMWPSNNN